MLERNPNGLYCAAGDFYIDPWNPVDRAVITHAHADHLVPGSKRYLTTRPGERLLRARLGAEAAIESLDHGEETGINGVRVSFHPAGHILGSAQVRIAHRGEIWVVSGDYKLAADPTCAAFEPIKCHTFVTESTFGLPIFRWPEPREALEEIRTWWRGNQQAGKASVLFAYPLGKAQRVLADFDSSIGPIYTHGAVEQFNRIYRECGIALPATVVRADSATQDRLDAGADSCAANRQDFAMAAALRRFFDRLRFGLDANPRHAAPAIDRSRLRAVRSCRLAGACSPRFALRKPPLCG